MTALGAIHAVAEILEKADIEDSRFEAEQILCSLLGLTASELRLQNPKLSEPEEQKILFLAQRRGEGYPLQYLLGEWEFFGLPFIVGEGVLIPRADTEILVETALDFIGDQQNLNIIDLCSGSGCIAIAIEKNTANCNVSALEKESAALEFLNKNIKLNRSAVSPIEGDVMVPQGGGYDLIVSNPPYITAKAMKALQKEVTHEPTTALFGGEDGLHFYRVICEKWIPLLNRGGMLAAEIGFDQRYDVMKLFETHGLTEIRCIKDYGGQDRVITGIKPI